MFKTYMTHAQLSGEGGSWGSGRSPNTSQYGIVPYFKCTQDYTQVHTLEVLDNNSGCCKLFQAIFGFNVL